MKNTTAAILILILTLSVVGLKIYSSSQAVKPNQPTQDLEKVLSAIKAGSGISELEIIIE